MAHLILVRHGQSVWNLENLFTGWKDVDLSEKGIEEAKNAGISLQNEKIDFAFTSKLKRAQDTLHLIIETAHFPEFPITENLALNERAYGDLEGLNKAETAKKFGEEQVMKWRRSYDIAPPNGESLKDTYDRVLPYYKSAILPLLNQNKNILIVAHGNSLRALTMAIEKLSPEEIVKREIPTGSPIIYDYNPENDIYKRII